MNFYLCTYFKVIVELHTLKESFYNELCNEQNKVGFLGFLKVENVFKVNHYQREWAVEVTVSGVKDRAYDAAGNLRKTAEDGDIGKQ